MLVHCAVLGVVILSVCHTHALWLIQRTYRRYFYTTWKGNPSSQMWFFVVVQQLTRFQLTLRVAWSLCDSWATCYITYYRCGHRGNCGVSGGIEPWLMALWKACVEFLSSVIELHFLSLTVEVYKAKCVKTHLCDVNSLTCITVYYFWGGGKPLPRRGGKPLPRPLPHWPVIP